ncbi:hypothetical protein ACFV2L_34750 [Streptomyces sp. NPDC059687]|uniref:hypothetical protein n=1 Tax=Streptomyces sp. NPDC059687 TaxID=3346905 RepID=UPI0036ABBC07
MVEHGQPGAAAPIFAVFSGSGLPAGWLYGLHRWRAAPPVQLLLATGALMFGTWLLLTAGSPFGLGWVAVLTGATIPPLLALLSQLAESTVHPSVLTQAFSWLGSASAAGSAAAAATAMTLQSLAGLRLLHRRRAGRHERSRHRRPDGGHEHGTRAGDRL